MSTRCQVKVTDGEDKITLYHHHDGYPTYMLSKIREAWEKYGKGWEGGRVGKVAGMLCAVDPIEFEPEDGHSLHGDIEWYYVVNCKSEMHMGAEPVWQVTTNKVGYTSKPKKIKTLLVSEISDTSAEEVEKEGYKGLEGEI